MHRQNIFEFLISQTDSLLHPLAGIVCPLVQFLRVITPLLSDHSIVLFLHRLAHQVKSDVLRQSNGAERLIKAASDFAPLAVLGREEGCDVMRDGNQIKRRFAGFGHFHQRLEGGELILVIAEILGKLIPEENDSLETIALDDVLDPLHNVLAIQRERMNATLTRDLHHLSDNIAQCNTGIGVELLHQGLDVVTTKEIRIAPEHERIEVIPVGLIAKPAQRCCAKGAFASLIEAPFLQRLRDAVLHSKEHVLFRGNLIAAIAMHRQERRAGFDRTEPIV